jgi:hypothetical protein
MLVAERVWNPEALFDMFLHGVSEEVKDELAARELQTHLDLFIALTIQSMCDYGNEGRRGDSISLARPRIPPRL